MSDAVDLTVPNLGECQVDSPLGLNTTDGDEIANYVPDEYRLLMDASLRAFRERCRDGEEPLSFELAGPRQKIYFDPAKVKAAIVTCGGLCPGLNNVIRGLVMQLHHRYGVGSIFGIKYGFQGFIAKYHHALEELTPKAVSQIHGVGGTVLGSSRGNQPIDEIVDSLERLNVRVLFTAGGDGTLRGAQQIYEEVTRRGLKIAVVGVPKTIDNDIPYISRTFGYDTAVDMATLAIRSAHVEALGAPNGVGVVKLMGRHSGYIACSAAQAIRDVNLVLVPEQKFDLNGGKGILSFLEKRLKSRGHAVIVVAEGAGQEIFEASGERDASGNVKLQDIGLFLSAEIKRHFKELGWEINLKYIDPSYIIRAAPANSKDAIFCGSLAEYAAHAAMAGKTGIVVGLWHDQFTHVPLAAATAGRKTVSLEGELWRSTLESTGQPPILHA
ncbi:MAG: ATP-dependent 6-phosphofructokinase [bacterium]